MFDLAHPPGDFAQEPFGWYDRLLSQAPVCAQPDGSFILSKHADLSAIYRDTTRFISDKRAAFAPKFGAGTPLFEHHTTSLVFNDPPLHSRVRSIMTSALTPRAINRMAPGLTAMVDQLLDRLPRQADLIKDYAAQIPVQVIGNLLDVPMTERGPLRGWSLAILGALEPVVIEAQMAAGHAAVTEFSDYLRELIARRRRHPGDPDTDVLTRLIAGDTTGSLTESELIQNCIFILNAGHETTTNLIGNGLALLHDTAGARDLLRRQPELIAATVEEVLRFNAPNQFGNRQCADDFELRGVRISKGANLHLCIGAANRDPEAFATPDRFDITRQPNRHLSFAGGPHVCVGLTLARLEGRVALQRFVDRFPGYRITTRRMTGRIRFRGYARLKAVMHG